MNIEDLKCCGNCEHFEKWDDLECKVEEEGEYTWVSNVCKKWSFGLESYADRIKERS